MRRFLFFSLLVLAYFTGWSQQRSVFDDTAFIYDNEFAQSIKHNGQSYLEATGLVFYDFSQLTGTDGTALSNGNAGLEDLSANANTATIINTPTIEDLTIAGNVGVKTLGTSGNNAITTGHDGTSWFTSDFRLIMSFWIADGQPGANTYLFGVSTSGGNFYALLAGATNNEINIRYSTPSGDSRWDSNNTALLADGPGFYVIEIDYDFTNDQIEVLLNGSAVSGAFVSGSMAGLDPVDFDPTVDFVIGSTNINGTIQTNATAMQISRFAIVSGSGSVDDLDVREYFNFSPSGVGGFARWTVHETAGFTYSVSNDTLKFTGEPGVWSDYFQSKEEIPDSIHEFRLQMTFRISDDLTTTTSGIGIGIKNDVDTEENRAVVAEFFTDTDHPWFGRVAIGAGNGTINPSTGITIRSTSGPGGFIPAKDSTYILSLQADVQGSDIFWFAEIEDPNDSLILTTAWTEVNAPSVQFTRKIWIHQNGGSFDINPITLYRTGDEIIPVGGGGDTEYDIHVRLTGNDANDCTESAPCRTFNRGFDRAVELGTPGLTLLAGPGTFVETSFNQVPTNLAKITGSGQGITIVTGATNLYRSFTQNGSLWLWQMHSEDTEATEISDLTFDGANRQILGAISQKLRDSVTLKNIEVRNFGFGGIWLSNVSNNSLLDFTITSCGGNSANGSYSTGALILSHLTNVIIDRGVINNSVQGTGYALKVLRDLSTPSNFTNVEIANITSTVNSEGGFVDVNGNTIANLNFEFFDHVNDNLSIHDCAFIGGTSISFGKQSTGVTPGNTYIYNNVFLPGQRTSGSYISVMECHADNLKVYDNYAACRSFMYIFNGNPGGSSYTGWEVHHNYVEIIGPGSFGMGALVSPALFPLVDAKIQNNTLVYLNSSGQIKPPIYISATAGQSTILVEDNAIYGQAPVNQNFFGISGSGLTASISRNNKATHINTLQTVSGLTGGAGQGNETGLNGSGWFNFSGTKPTPYYATPSGSYLRDKGNGNDDVGAYQHE